MSLSKCQLEDRPDMGRICLVTSHRYGETLGGIEVYVKSLSKWLQLNGIRTIIVARRLSFLNPISVSFSDKSSKSILHKPIRLIHIPYIAYIMHMVFHSLMASLRIIKLMKKYQFVVIHAHDNFAILSAILVKKLIKIRVVGHSHGPEIYQLQSPISRFFWMALDKYVTSRVDQMLVTDFITFDYFVSLGVPKDKILIIPTGIEFPLFQQIEDPAIIEIRKETQTQGKFVVGYVGRLSREKNVRRLVEAFADITSETKTNLKLVLVGDGPERINLEAVVSEKNLGKSVFFTGWRTDVRNLLSTFDVFALPSLFEGCPRALLEAMATSRAIVASSIPSIQKIVRHGKEAILVNPYRVEKLKQAILLLYNDPNLRAELGHSAREMAKLYDIDSVYPQILKVYCKDEQSEC